MLVKSKLSDQYSRGDVVVYSLNPDTWKADVGLWIQGYPDLQATALTKTSVSRSQL
ncbi:mCG13813 [Mus musculus]|nr:mCG13813 [Mus musculus]